MQKHLNIKVYGIVQGVFFRYSAKEKADELGITGFARNEPDGSAYIEAEAEEAALKEFLNWCKDGPQMAAVEKIEHKSTDKMKNFKSFVVK